MAQQLLAQNRTDVALSKAREAVSLAPGDPRPHFTLALVLKNSGQTLEARREFVKTIQLTDLDPATWPRLKNRAEKELKKLSKYASREDTSTFVNGELRSKELLSI